jgi:hypothetical protein
MGEEFSWINTGLVVINWLCTQEDITKKIRVKILFMFGKLY